MGFLPFPLVLKGGFLVLIVLIVVGLLIVATLGSPLRGAMIKEGVILAGIQTEMLPGIAEAREVYREHSYDFWITSGLEGVHGKGSLHPLGLASDFRVRDPGPSGDGSDGLWNIPLKERQVMAREIGDRAGENYDVVLKPDHIHMEYQPDRWLRFVSN